MPGHANQVKAMAVPLRQELSVEVIDRALGELAGAGLVVWYEVEGRPILEFPRFERHQKGLRKKREAESNLPSSKVQRAQRVTTSLRSSSGVGPEQVRSTPDLLRPSEVKSSEVKDGSIQPPVEFSGDTLGREGINPEKAEREQLHPALQQTWLLVEPLLLAPHWHDGPQAVVLAGGKRVELGLERLKVDDLLHRTDGDASKILWAVCHAREIFGWDDTERYTLYWFDVGENWSRIEGAYHKALTDSGYTEDVRVRSPPPKPEGAERRNERQQELHAQLEQLRKQEKPQEPQDGLTTPTSV